MDISLYSMENKEKNENASNELKNPYIKKDDVPEFEFINKNTMIICDKEEYKIKEYFENINNTTSDLLDDEKYNYCGIFKNNLNIFFCFIY